MKQKHFYTLRVVAVGPQAFEEFGFMVDTGFNVVSTITDDIEGVCDALRAASVDVASVHNLTEPSDDAFRCPLPALGPRTLESSRGEHLSFAPGNDACTVCDHCGQTLGEHGV